MTETLKWCIDWNNPSFKEKFLMGAPFVATENKVYKDIVRQLEGRSQDAFAVWKDVPVEIQEMALTICTTVKSDGIWPSNVFLPGDPADIPFGLHFDFTDKWDFLPYSVDLVEKRLRVKMPVDFYDHLERMTFVEAVTEICKRKAEQSAAPLPSAPQTGSSEGAR